MPAVVSIVFDDLLNIFRYANDFGVDLHTPNFDRLAAMGVTFDNAYATVAVCNPSRTSALSGQSPFRTGLHNTDDLQWQDILTPGETLVGMFGDAGFTTIGTGKVYHNSTYITAQDMFAQIYSQHYQPQPNPAATLDHNVVAEPLEDGEVLRDDLTVPWAVQQLLAFDDSQDALFTIGIARPHQPFIVPQEYFDLYPRDQLIIPYVDGDLNDVSQFYLQFRLMNGYQNFLTSNDAELDFIQGYLAAVSYADAQLGLLLDAIEQNPELADAAIVVWSDHGYELGQKHTWHKFTLWEEAANIPFVIVAPGLTGGTAVDTPVSLLDMLPTMLDLAGITPPAGAQFDGESVLQFIDTPNPDRAVVTSMLGSLSMRLGDYRFIFYNDGSVELYDVVNDPAQITNLAPMPENAALVEQLTDRLIVEVADLGGTFDPHALTLLGSNGTDSMYAIGDQTMIGGLGDDVYFITDQGTVVEAADGGHDTIIFAAPSIIIPENVEFVTNTAYYNIPGGITVTGNDQDNHIAIAATRGFVHGGMGNDIIESAGAQDSLYGEDGDDAFFSGAGTDRLFGGNGNDRLEGQAGADTLDGGDGSDTAAYGFSVVAVRASLVDNRGYGGDAQGDVYISIENLAGSGLNDTLIGNSGANILAGGEGNDSIDGGSGNDQITGHLGDDTLYGGIGDDLISGGTENDSIDGGAGNDILAGNEGNDVLRGSGGIDLLSGSTGSDTLFGGDGADLLEGGADNDRIDAGFGSGDIANGGDGRDVISGQEGSDFLSGDAGNDTLYGGTENDELDGGTGNDRLNGDDGDDTLGGGAGADILNGGLGNDIASYASSGAGIVLDLASGAFNTGDAAGDVFTAIEQFVGTGFADQLSGADLNDILDGGAGNDTLNGRNGNDTLRGGDGDDLLIGGSGADAFFGGTGSNTVTYAGSTAQVVVNMATPSASTGAAQGDTFSDIGTIIATGFDDIVIGNSLANTIIGGAGADTLNGAVGNDSLDGGEQDDSLFGGSGNDGLTGGSGNDTLNGSTGADTIDGGDGNDQVLGGFDNDVLHGGAGTDVLNGSDGNDTLFADDDTAPGADALTGGAGIDTAVFSGNWGDYTVTGTFGNYQLTRGGATTVVTGVELFQFANGTFNAADILNDISTAADTSGSFDENLSDTSVIATVAASDLDTPLGDVLGFAITAGNAAGLFKINASGQISLIAGQALDYEADKSHSLTVTVTDIHGAAATATVVVNVTDLNDNAPVFSSALTASVDENLAASTVIYTAQATDADISFGTVTYSIGGIDAAAFSIDAVTGELRLLNPADFETQASYSLTVTATQGTTSTDQALTIAVADLNDAPVVPAATATATQGGSVVSGTLTASDADSGAVLTYALDAPVAGLTLNSDGTYSFDPADAAYRHLADLATEPVVATYTVTDEHGASSSAALTITLTGVNDAPEALTLDSAAIIEYAAAGTVVGQLSASDPDDGATLTYALIDDAGGRFALSGSTVVAGSVLTDFEQSAAHTVVVQVTDELGLTHQETLTITVANRDPEVVDGTALAESIIGSGLNDRLNGGAGNDTLLGGEGNDQLDGGLDADLMQGGNGDDRYYVDNVADSVDESTGSGLADEVRASVDYTLADGIEVLRLEGLAAFGGGNALNNRLSGNAVANTLQGLDGTDLLQGLDGADSLAGGSGNDTLTGGNGNDQLSGGTGRDILRGDAGEDVFVFAEGDFAGTTNTTADRISDFVQGTDRIDLSLTDAVAGGTDDGFSFIGGNAFSLVAGELRFVRNLSETLILGDVDGDGTADIAIVLTGSIVLTESDFVL